MHPCPAKGLPASTGCAYEQKYDGFRALVTKAGQTVRIFSRSSRDIAGSFPELVADLLASPRDFTIDGELVVCDELGHPQFDLVTRRALMTKKISIEAGVSAQPAAVMAFDLLEIDGLDQRR